MPKFTIRARYILVPETDTVVETDSPQEAYAYFLKKGKQINVPKGFDLDDVKIDIIDDKNMVQKW